MAMIPHGGGQAPVLPQMFGPGIVDVTIRQAISMCWMTLPDDKRTIDRVEHEIRRILDRVIQSIREDEQAFRN